MGIAFCKMHADGDDFVLVDARDSSTLITEEMARALGDRHRGIGFNQLAVIKSCDDAGAELEFWNADGTGLDACGSATRGVADYLMREAGSDAVSIRTKRGLLQCERALGETVSVLMGPPLTGWREIPLSQDVDTASLPLPGVPSACSMGNPHCTFFVDDLSTIDVAVLGAAFEGHPLFPEKTNVHFAKVLDRGRIRLRIWERGGGIPLGSGSCSCGAVVAGIRQGLLDQDVEVLCDGGAVKVSWDGVGSVRLIGPVQPIYSGVVDGRLFG